MCIGLPCHIVSIDEQNHNNALVDINGVQRHVDISLVTTDAQTSAALIGKWVLVHVGFAMAIIDEQEALDTLETLKAMEELEPDVGIFMTGEG